MRSPRVHVLRPIPGVVAGVVAPVPRGVEALAVHIHRVRPSLHVPARPDHAESHVLAGNHRELHKVTPRPHRHRARRSPVVTVEGDAVPRRHRPALRQRDLAMRPATAAPAAPEAPPPRASDPASSRAQNEAPSPAPARCNTPPTAAPPPPGSTAEHLQRCRCCITPCCAACRDDGLGDDRLDAWRTAGRRAAGRASPWRWGGSGRWRAACRR